MQTNYITEFLNLKGIEAKKISHGDNFIKVFLETNVSEQKCPCCGKRISKVHDYRTQVIKDSFYNDKLILLSLKKETANKTL
ncbi:MAG: hypothetical protein R3Y53_10190 [Bacillota bacterium]